MEVKHEAGRDVRWIKGHALSRSVAANDFGTASGVQRWGLGA